MLKLIIRNRIERRAEQIDYWHSWGIMGDMVRGWAQRKLCLTITSNYSGVLPDLVNVGGTRGIDILYSIVVRVRVKEGYVWKRGERWGMKTLALNRVKTMGAEARNLVNAIASLSKARTILNVHWDRDIEGGIDTGLRGWHWHQGTIWSAHFLYASLNYRHIKPSLVALYLSL
jgi:hypothetical protein